MALEPDLHSGGLEGGDLVFGGSPEFYEALGLECVERPIGLKARILPRHQFRNIIDQLVDLGLVVVNVPVAVSLRLGVTASLFGRVASAIAAAGTNAGLDLVGVVTASGLPYRAARAGTLSVQAAAVFLACLPEDPLADAVRYFPRFLAFDFGPKMLCITRTLNRIGTRPFAKPSAETNISSYRPPSLSSCGTYSTLA